MRRIRISVAGVMALVAVVALDFAVIPALRQAPTDAIRLGVFGALPMANVLAVYLAIVVSGLARRGEVSLSRLAFLFVGGTATLVVLSIAILAPYVFFRYIHFVTDGLGFNMSLLRALLAWATLILTILVPALLAGWLTRGYDLRVLKGPEAENDAGRALLDEPRPGGRAD
jgi:hypothetical protein